MKIYAFGDKDKPAIMLFPGTCCYWKTNFGHVLEPLQAHFYTMVVSYSGFDETENSTFISELEEVEKIESYIKDHLDGSLFAAYGCSLGGSVVSLLVGRHNIHINHAIIGSSDMDQAPKWLAKLETAIMLPLIYPFLTGDNKCFMKKKSEKMIASGGERAEAVLHRPVYPCWSADQCTRYYDPRILRPEDGGKIPGALSEIFCSPGHPGIRPAA